MHKSRLGKRVELLAGEENKSIKIGVMSQRVYNDLTEGHRSPGWVSVSFSGFLHKNTLCCSSLAKSMNL